MLGAVGHCFFSCYALPMVAMQAEVFDAFRSLGMAEEKASLAAQALNRQDPDLVAMRSDVAAIKADIGTLKSDMAIQKWAVALIVAGIIALLLKSFLR